MERLLTAEQMRFADEYTINNLGIPHEVLIERAGLAVTEEITKRFFGGRVLVCIGKGNNGADGKVIAELLSKKHGFSVATLNADNGIFKLFDKKFDIIVDCLFGTGLNREITGKYKEAIEKINSSGAYVVSCDIASGLNADNGMVMGACVKANLTVAIQELKLGQFLNDGPDYSGEIVAKDIGISIWDDQVIHRLRAKDITKFFSPRKVNVNKGDFGKALVIGGSEEYPGSIILSYNALSSLKMGAGYSYIAVPKNLVSTVLTVCPECIVTSYDEGENNLNEKLDKLLTVDAISVGMGMGNCEKTYKTVEYLLNNYEGKLIIDADGLNALSSFGKEVLKIKKCEVVLTPHIGEFARLLGIDKETVLSDSARLCKEFAKEYQVTVLLKSAVSIISDGEITYVNTKGNPGMAKAGSGDVLSGLMAGLFARGISGAEGATVACYILGSAGNIAKKEGHECSITASDIISCIGKAIKELSRN